MAMRGILSLLLSLRTTIWLFLALLCLLFYGAILMPGRKEFQTIHDTPLLRWMSESPGGVTWWLWAAVAILSLLTANTLFCSVESVIKKRSARQWLMIIAPQVVHAGFLFVLLAHLLSSIGGFKGSAVVHEGAVLSLPNGTEAMFHDIRMSADPRGFLSDWSMAVTYTSGGKRLASHRIRPNEPSFREGFGVYIKEVRAVPFPMALIEVSREPGALSALAGGVLFMVGMAALLLLKIRREEAEG